MFSPESTPAWSTSINRQSECILSQLAHVESFSQRKNTHFFFFYFVEYTPWQQLFCFCEWQLTDNSMWAAKIFPVALPQSKTYYSQTALAAESKAGWGGGAWWWMVGSRGCYYFTIFQHITAWNTTDLVLIHFRRSGNSPAASVSHPEEGSITAGLHTGTVLLIPH